MPSLSGVQEFARAVTELNSVTAEGFNWSRLLRRHSPEESVALIDTPFIELCRLIGLPRFDDAERREGVPTQERGNERKKIVHALSAQLLTEYGSGFSAKNLRHTMKFAEVFPDEQIVSTLWRQLSWSHFKEIIYLKKPLQREFYAEMCRVEG